LYYNSRHKKSIFDVGQHQPALKIDIFITQRVSDYMTVTKDWLTADTTNCFLVVFYHFVEVNKQLATYNAIGRGFSVFLIRLLLHLVLQLHSLQSMEGFSVALLKINH
jgi:hypothetical protein